MPNMDGLAFGEKIQELLPSVEIVFTTGFDQYVIDAFNLRIITGRCFELRFNFI
ncbi:hypothetical protein ACIQGW_20970 [Lysinibacillus xylanilyticus]|uniref:hypothetical protein n=1 Tax=Lysinibacillus xylanilyticus TaxID=582475 RepID=UPI0038058434